MSEISLCFIENRQGRPLTPSHVHLSCLRFTISGQKQVSGLLRLAVISLGPIVFNMAILLVLFLVSLFLGPMLNNCCAKFGAVQAGIAHGLSVIGMLAFFELLVSGFPFWVGEG